SFEDPIRRELLTQELDTAEDYEPISYAWGDPTMSHEIMCNDCSLFITKNLFQALRRFRGTQPRFLWADGICINQSDEAEKSSQVSFMSRIYEKGYQTLIWLGEDDEHDGWAMSASATSNLISWQELDGLHCLSHLFRRPWFSRIWVINEVGLSK
ncbi:heterokaryon incompatibility, partial [Mollisia scopiformis]